MKRWKVLDYSGDPARLDGTECGSQEPPSPEPHWPLARPDSDDATSEKSGNQQQAAWTPQMKGWRPISLKDDEAFKTGIVSKMEMQVNAAEMIKALPLKALRVIRHTFERRYMGIEATPNLWNHG